MSKYSEEEIKEALSQALEEFSDQIELKQVELAGIDTGDIVLTPKGPGVVASEMRSNFNFPTGEGSGDENTQEIEASQDQPAYVVGFVGSSGVYRASDLEERSVDGPDELRDIKDEESDGDDAIATVNEVDFEETDMPEGWDQWSLMSFYAEQGGEVTEMRNALEDEQGFNEESAIRMAASMKDQVVGTERWRSRF